MSFTIHVELLGDQGPSCVVNVAWSDTIGDVTDNAAKALRVDACTITLHHDGVPLDDRLAEVTRTTLVEGSEVEAKVGVKYAARAVLADMGLGWGVDDLFEVVLSGDDDEEKAGVVRIMLDADGALDTVGGPMCEAARLGLLETVKMFVTHKGPDAHDTVTANTPLHYAAVSNHLPVLQYLTSAGANLEATNSLRSTPLHDAVRFSTPDSVLHLIQAGANTEAKTNGRTALAIAKKRGMPEMVSILENAGK